MAGKKNLNDVNQKIFDDIVYEICSNSRLDESKDYIQHGRTTLYEHSISVAFISYTLALRLGLRINKKDLIRGALLHDYFLYDWHVPDSLRPMHGFYHPRLALENAQSEFTLSAIERDIILHHMFPLTLVPPKFMEGLLVCLVDKYCSINETIRRKKVK